ncbi:hypothetical protein KC19_3G257100 [Ceratodon purpureus]|uniref:Major facilitator superfamily (MFS) profile domain-containing protein n=1 Tax=Ceratodon purpureus TaxID=3225 RepID=A0A8T0IR40_CERPU|nr:hypothetical protein KC19_3G257100 [Ceratodon purpureus]
MRTCGREWWSNEATRTLLMVNLAGIMERADEALLPGVYREIGLAMHASPAKLGSLTLVRSLVQAFCAPLAAYASVNHNRANVIALGAFLWAVATFFVGISGTFTQVAISRALNGVGLAMVIPAIQSLVADSTEEHERGVAFGWLQLTGNIGSIMGGFLSVILAGGTFFGYPGWRMSFHLVAIVSIVVGLLVRYFAVDPRFSEGRSPPPAKEGWQGLWDGLKAMLVEAKHVCQIRTFQIFVAQGVAGNFPWAALAFAPMWLELTGFSHETTAVLLGVFSVGNSLGALFGGKMGDIMSLRMPNAGRIMLSQISSASGVPLAGILLLVVPIDSSTPVLHGVLFFIMGFMIAWNAAATNNPIFAEIVPAHARTTIYALDRSFESVLASFAPPIVGVLAENYYGYIPPQLGRDHATELVIDKENALSLSKALYTAIGIPLTLCCLIYTFLYWTYPRDRDRARALALGDAQLGSAYEFQKFSLGEENELEIIDVYGEHEAEDDDDDKDHHNNGHHNNGRSSETEWMFQKTKSNDLV